MDSRYIKIAEAVSQCTGVSITPHQVQALVDTLIIDAPTHDEFEDAVTDAEGEYLTDATEAA